MGKRIEITPYRQPRPASVIIKPYKLSDPVSDEIARGMSYVNEGIAALEELAHKRALKAAQMRRWRAKKRGKV